MNMMIRSIRSTLSKTLVLSALALSFLVIPASAFDTQESDGSEQQRRRHSDQPTFTPIDFPGATFTTAFDINDRGQIVGTYLKTNRLTLGRVVCSKVVWQPRRLAPSSALGARGPRSPSGGLGRSGDGAWGKRALELLSAQWDSH